MYIVLRNTKVFYLTQLLHSLIFTIPIWIVYYQGKISVVEISALVTIQYLSQMFLELPSGALADLLGRKITLSIGFLVGAASFFLFPLASQFWHFLILALMVGLMDSFRSGSEEALLYDTYKQNNKEKLFRAAYGKGNMLYQVGLITGTALGGLLFTFNVFLPYLLYGVSLLLGFFVSLFYIEPKIDSEKFTVSTYINQIKFGTLEVFKNEYVKYLSLFYIFVGGISWASTLYFNEFMLVEFGFSDDFRGYVSAFVRVLNVVFIASFLKNEKLFNFKRTVLFFPIIMLIAYLPGVYLNGIFGVPFIQLAMIVTTARWIILSPLTNEAFSSKYRATAISLLSLLIGFVYVFLTGISGLVIQFYGIRVMYTLLGILSVLVVLPITYKLLKVSKS